MKVSFAYAYESLIKLKNKDVNKVCFLFSSCFNRIRELVDFFELHSNCSVRRFSLSEIASLISSDGKTVKPGVKASVVHYLRESRPEYIVLEDNGDLPKKIALMDELCGVIRSVGDQTAVIVVSEYAAEFSILYGEAVMVDVPGLNERSLRIRASKCQTEELYLRNKHEVESVGVFEANQDFYDGFLVSKRLGDGLFSQGDYCGAFEKYTDAITFHSKYDVDECSINDFLRLTIYIRYIACFLYGKWLDGARVNRYLKETVEQMITKIQQSGFGELHVKMVKDYNRIFLGLKDGWLEKKNYLLFLNEYVF